MSHLYETHLHTSIASRCAHSRGSEYVRHYQDLGYSGIIVTDHFYRGYTAITKKLPWKEWVHRFCRGFEETRDEGARRGFDVFFGWEETFDGIDDYLVYGLDKEWLMEHPESQKWSRSEQHRAVRAAGGCVVQAHPFRYHSDIGRLKYSVDFVDGIEAANMGNDRTSDALAMRFARGIGLTTTAGTDIHNVERVMEGKVFGVQTKEKLTCIGDYVRAILANDLAGLKTTEGRFDWHGDEEADLPFDGSND